MPALITGAGGFVGQHLIRHLLELGEAEVFGGTLDGAPPEDPTLTSDELGRVRWLPLDVTGPGSIRAALGESGARRVYHLAGQSSVGDSFTDPAATWAVNATGTLHLLGAAAEVAGPEARVLVISSAEVYGAVDSDAPVPEDAPLAPLTPYGASKAAAEILARQAAASGALRVVVARSFNHTGPGQDARFIFPSMARQLAEIRAGRAEPVLRVGNLDARRDFLDVRDVARAYATLMEAGESGEVYNVCSGRDHSLRELVERLVEISGTGARIEVDPARVRPVDIPVLRGNPARLTALGWSAGIELRTTLQDLFRDAETRVG